MSVVALEQTPSAKVFSPSVRWLIATATTTTTQPEKYGFTVQLNTDQDSARRNFFHRFQHRDPDQEGSPCLAAPSTSMREVVGAVIFLHRITPEQIRGFFIAFAWQVRGKDASGGQMRGKLLMFFDKCEIL